MVLLLFKKKSVYFAVVVAADVYDFLNCCSTTLAPTVFYLGVNSVVVAVVVAVAVVAVVAVVVAVSYIYSHHQINQDHAG